MTRRGGAAPPDGTGPDGTPPADPVRRTLEIEDPTNRYVVHPIANRLTPLFARWGIRPNAVSLAGMAFGILAGVAYFFFRDAGLPLLGFLLMIGWHVMDGVDGQLARLTRTHSEFGKVLDGLCDYTTFGAVYIGLALPLSRQHGAYVWVLVAVSGVCHAVQSAVYEVQRQNYNHWGHQGASAEFRAPAVAMRDGSAGLPAHRRVADLLLRGYLRVQRVATGADAGFARTLEAMGALHPARAAETRRRYRNVFAPVVRQWSVMSANTRTVAIFVCALWGRPVAFFWFEIVGLSAALALLLRRQRLLSARLLTSLEQAT